MFLPATSPLLLFFLALGFLFILVIFFSLLFRVFSPFTFYLLLLLISCSYFSCPLLTVLIYFVSLRLLPSTYCSYLLRVPTSPAFYLNTPLTLFLPSIFSWPILFFLSSNCLISCNLFSHLPLPLFLFFLPLLLPLVSPFYAIHFSLSLIFPHLLQFLIIFHYSGLFLFLLYRP